MARPMNFSYVYEDRLAGSAHPGSGEELRETLRSLHEEGIRAILTLTEEPLDAAIVAESGIVAHHVPVVDFTAPSPEQVGEALDFLRRHTGDGSRALVHCRAGIGRTGTILACYLVDQGMDPSRAIREIRRLRPGSVEVYQQEFAVYQFGRKPSDEAPDE